jgi:hypothetical protein
MQPLRILTNWLSENANENRYLFSLQDLRALFPELSEGTFKTLLSRSVQKNVLERACRNIYAYKSSLYAKGLILFHLAAYLRSNDFNYISLETVLSDAGIISQIPINSISIMSSGRSNTISCGRLGKVEFIHTNQKPQDIIDQLTYDSRCRLWRANNHLALKDMKRTHRNCDLINLDLNP